MKIVYRENGEVINCENEQYKTMLKAGFLAEPPEKEKKEKKNKIKKEKKIEKVEAPVESKNKIVK
jgi:hypothetical protein